MHRKIDNNCSTKDTLPRCNEGISQKNCPSQEHVKNDTEKKESGISVVGSDAVGVWSKWKKRKPLTT